VSEKDLVVADDMVVSLAYVLTVDGEELDSADASDPLEYLQGHTQIIPGLEQALVGMHIGDEIEVTVEPAEAYGEYDEEEVDIIPLEAFPDDFEPAVGDDLQLRDTETGEVFNATVVELLDDEIKVDFNHPLAGETLTFKVQITGLRPATSEELAHGHVHETDGHSH
jgi:FKBP-type peptidyl-prolyl cis-trans isomerase SlyD